MVSGSRYIGKTGPPLTEYTLTTSSSDEESLKDEVAKSKLEESKSHNKQSLCVFQFHFL